jgi:hypothetical protein
MGLASPVLPFSIAEPLLHLSKSFLAELDVLLSSLLSLLLEGMENEDCSSELCDVEDPMLCLSVDSDFDDAGTHTRHRSIVIWVKAELDQVELMPRLAARVFRKLLEILAASPDPVQSFGHWLII